MRTELALIVAIVGLMPVASRAQESGGAVGCPSIQNDQERLACYDRAMRGAPRAQAAPQPSAAAASAPPTATPPAAIVAPAVVAGAAATTSTPAPAAVAPASTAPASVAPVAVTPAAVASSPAATGPAAPPAASSTAAAAPVVAAAAATAVAAPSAQAAAAPTSAAATPSSTVSTAPHSPRNTHAATPPPPGSPPTFDPNTGAPTAIFPVVVVNARVRPGLGTEFTTDNAGVWIQTEVKPLSLPKAPFNAELQPGTFGSTFLVLPDRKMGIRVRPPNK